MKTKFVVKLAVAAVLALGSVAQAQEEAAAIPAVDAPVPVPVAAADVQQSVSDNVVVEGEVAFVAPVAPIQESVIFDPNAAVGNACIGCGQASGCVGCGQSNPVFSAPLLSAPLLSAPLGSRINAFRNQGSCSSCDSCSSCGVVQAAQFAPAQFVGAPVASACAQGCDQCGQIGQIAFNQQVYQAPISSVPTTFASTPTSVVSGAIGNPAPLPTTQILSGCGSAGCGSPCGGQVTTCGAAPAVACNTCDTCDTCQTGRTRLLRGRLFRNR
jgi:hypothetical protein